MPRLSKFPEVPSSISRPISSSTNLKAAAGPQAGSPSNPLPPNKRFRLSTGTSKASPPTSLPITSSEPSFICTICWQSQHAPSKPKLLGASSRIVCRPCWKAVLDLSICWVCGECIVRGDEVVSLGWCFWHRACFGCLVCGTGMDLEGFENGSGVWGQWDHVGKGLRGYTDFIGGGRENSGTMLGKRKRMIGVELERVPLCESCDVETAGASYADVVERSLETISRFDGGLTRDRLDMLSEEREETEKVRRSRWKKSRFRGSSGLERELKRFINGSSSKWSEFIAADDPEAQKALIKNAAKMGILEDGIMDEENSPIGNETISFEEPQEESVFYVSVLNPLDEAPFKSSKTKPLPRWMSLLPNNVHCESKRRWNSATSEPFANSHEMARLDKCGIDIHIRLTENNNEDMPDPAPDEGTPIVEYISSILPVEGPINVSEELKISHKNRLPISADPSQDQAYGSLSQGSKVTECTNTAYTPRTSAGEKTPYSSRRRSLMTRSETTSCSSYGIPKFHMPNDISYGQPETKSQSPQSSPVLSQSETSSRNSSIGYVSLHSEGPSPLVVSSSEYLDRYKPKAPKTTYQKYVAKEPEPIMDKIRRQRPGRRSQEDVAKATNEKQRSSSNREKVGDKDYKFDPAREDLNKELRSLFCKD